MLRLRLFGGPTLERDGAPLTGRAAQRHRLALLALLALAPGRRLTRDKLIGILWPESDADRGRNLLKVATYVIRSELGEAVLVSAGDELRLDTTQLAVDAVAFEDALARGDREAAWQLYQGPLLDGFFLDGAPEFEKWVDAQRARLAAGCHAALEALAEQAAAAHDLPKAAAWWKARAAQDPYDSRVALRLMQALDASGNRAGALQHAAIHQRLLLEEFGVAAPPEVAALAERLREEPAERVEPGSTAPRDTRAAPGRAPAAVPPAATYDAPAAASPADATGAAPPPVPTGTRPAERVPPRWPFRAAAIVFLAIVLVAVRAMWSRPDDAAQSIVVLPFVNLSADADDEYFSDGLTEEIITRLAGVPGLKVISRTSAMHYKGTDRPLPEIAAELGVDHILEGSVRQADGRVRVSAQLIDARDDGHVWAETYEYRVDDRFQVQEQLAREVAQALEVRLGAQARRLLARQGTDDPVAYDLYQRGRHVWNTRTREAHAQAIRYYDEAIARDSSYADAYAGLALVYLTGYQLDLLGMPEQEAYERLKWAAERALALDEESADAHLALAIAQLWQRNMPGAEREYRRALELNPGHATARSWHALLLRGMGRQDEALAEARRAVELDPFGIIALHNYGWQCYIVRDTDCAIEQLTRSAELGSYPGAERALAIVYAHLGRFDEALRAIDQAMALAPQRTDFIGDLAYVHARAGNAADARRHLEQAKVQPFEAFNVARAYVALGEADSAFAWLERSSFHWPHRAALADPTLDPLRTDPRFARLEERVQRAMGLRSPDTAGLAEQEKR